MGRPTGATGETRAEVRRLFDAGLSPRSIALALGLSTQAIYQHLRRLGKDGDIEWPRKDAA